MKTNGYGLKLARIAAAILGATLALVFLLALLAGPRIRAAPLSAGTGDDPHIRAITVTASLPISDTHPGDGISKTVYFNNFVPGVISLTFEISGTPTLTLTAGAAFGDAAQTYTSTTTPCLREVTYTVETGDGNYSGVGYTTINTNGLQTTVAITYVRDITAPTVHIFHPPTGFFTGTRLVITGTADDGVGAGVQSVRVTTGTTWATAIGRTSWAYTTTLPSANSEVYTISARAEDWMGAASSLTTKVITVDNIAPANPAVVTTTNGTVTGTWISHNTIPVSWTTVSDGSRAAYYYYKWDQNDSTTLGSGNSFTTATAVTGTNLPQGDDWFHLRTRDSAGNWASTTFHLGPFKVDINDPLSAVSAPADGDYYNSLITISGAANDTGGSGLDRVEMRIISGTVNWNGSAWVGGEIWLTTTNAANWSCSTGLPTWQNGISYTVRSRATDNAGNVETPGTGNIFGYDDQPPAISSPGISIISNHDAFYVSDVILSVFYTNTRGAGTFAVTGNAEDGFSGLDRAAFSEAFGQTSEDASPDVFTGIYDVPAGATVISGVITATVYDNAGNTAVQTYTYELDSTPPDSVASALAYATSSPITVTWVATDTQSGVYSTTLWYKKEVAGAWTASQAINAASGTFSFTPTNGDGLYLFATVAVDNLGNLEAAPTVSETQTLYDTNVPHYVYLPMVMHNYSPFSNGDFESGLSGWDTGRGPFDGHGSGMPQSVVSYEGDPPQALLGERDASNGSIHVGYGYIAQTFTVDKPRLQLEYRVISYDIVENNQRYYDTFEVSVNKRPENVLDAERNSRGCASTVLNPTGVLMVTNTGLAFCGGRSGTSSDVGNKWDSDWKTVTLDLSAFQGENVTLYLAIWSREYDSPYYNDRGWYNTWAYVDNLSPQD